MVIMLRQNQYTFKYKIGQNLSFETVLANSAMCGRG